VFNGDWIDRGAHQLEVRAPRPSYIRWKICKPLSSER
jgi:hypothetical protein